MEQDERERLARLLAIVKPTPAYRPSERGIGRIKDFWRREYREELDDAGAAGRLEAAVRLAMILFKADLERRLAEGGEDSQGA